ncbi:polysaccharide biosynthesis tyrosine autokinase [Pseudomonas fragi]|uniref:Polysaccharide biosynthesis tyrosine autokinase n=1 Tax=Pseudomonas fragi TaxID=296 RepID=A0A9Q6VI57_PSEFR|nr:polysaccharide biosynthesis tyrosine autokinase [Pseudomonas fragi]MBM1198648.1 polysaccharide biosynthesis tyrosine autokinase [Pseudomonas fragi]MDE4516567.1 polysaccharide biosynthesis tyrosine autokinase [Pseudomonas fragi]NNB04939.1 polysaccharide biosynthesis tyrosine autokinase [Pseudomonas fragi]NNB55548.1 polysaccharide biosynthesis tyrosine autokinase [Pseudomonas fragi]NNB57498.1 polysaccharide biosynthesis tyrosine autokinase [Pseudomonas fragi]
MQQAPVTKPHEQDDDNDEIDLMGLLGTLIDHKWLIAGVTGVFMAAGVAYALLATPVYQANALIQVEAKKNDMLGFSDIGSMLGKESPSATEIELIKSRRNIGAAVDNLKLDIEVEPNYFPLIGEFVARRFKPDAENPVASPLLGMNSFAWGGEHLKLADLQLPQELLGTDLTLVAGEGGSFTLLDEDSNVLVKGQVGQAYEQNGVKVQVESLQANPGTTFEVVRYPRLTTILNYQKDLDVSERGKESGMVALALESPEPETAIRTLNEIARLYVQQNIERTSAEAAQSLGFLKDQLPQVRKDLEKAENALNAFQIRSKSIDISLEAKAILDQIVALDTSISTLKLQQAEMDRKFTPQHPAYRALMGQLAELTSKQQRLAKQVENLPTTQQELLSLTRDLKVSTEIYTQLLNKSQELDVMRAGAVGNVLLIDTADVDLRYPVKPKKALIVLIATLLGAFLSIAYVLFRKALNRGVENPDDIEKLGLPVYASIPFSSLQKVEDEKSPGGRGTRVTPLLASSHPTDLAIEGLRSLRTSLHFAMLEATNNRLMISGPSPKVGKSFVSANLAAVIAQSGQKVLLVDVDMRKGYIHKMFGIPVENGLSDLLAKRCDLDTAIHKTEVENLDVIGRGQIPPNPSELLMHKNFSDFLEEISARYDQVILDTPPFLAVADAAIVGRQSGTNLIVTRFELNPAREVELTMRRFAQNGIELKGAIFNGVEKRASAKYGYGAYGYYNYEYKSDSV